MTPRSVCQSIVKHLTKVALDAFSGGFVREQARGMCGRVCPAIALFVFDRFAVSL